MKKKEQELLLEIAESVGELFSKLKKNEGQTEITFDQGVCIELWDRYDKWSSYHDDLER